MTERLSDSEIVVELAEEFIERYRNGERPPLKEYAEKYPELAGEIRDVFPAMAMMENIAVEDESLDADGAPPAEALQFEQLGDYRVIREVGRGGMGVVYEAEQVSLGRHVALKVLPKQLLLDAKQKRRFERESKAAAKLHHTNIVPVFGVGEDEGLHYYVMQFIQGLGLDEVLDELKRIQDENPSSTPATGVEFPVSRRSDVSAVDVARSLMTGGFPQTLIIDDLLEEDSGSEIHATTIDLKGSRSSGNSDHSRQSAADTSTSRLSDTFVRSGSISLPGQAPSEVVSKSQAKKLSYWQSVASMGVQVASALQYAHDQGIQHRDIKPSNLLLDLRGTVWVTDFGLAKTEDQQNITHTGDILGTLRYMPPEAFAGKSDHRGDIYSLGLTLYEMLALQPAFDERDRNKLIRQVSQESAPPLEKLNRDIPRDLVTIIHKAIERDPAHRYQSGHELAADLQRFIDDEPIHARRISLVERFARWSRRNKSLSSSIAAIALLLVTFGIASFVAAGSFKHLAERETAARQQESRALKRETEARKQATAARKTAETRRREADAARKEAEAARYVADMNFARTLWEEGSIRRLNDILISHIPAPGQIDHRRFEWYYWWRATHLAAAAINVTGGSSAGHFDVSPDAKWLCVARWPNRVAILDRQTRKKVRDFEVPPGVYDHALRPRFSSDGRTLYCAGIDGTIARFDTATWERGPDLTKGLPPIAAIAVSPKRPQMAIAMKKDRIRILDTKTGKTLKTFDYKGTFWDMEFSPDGDTLTIGLHKRLVRVTGFLDDAGKPLWRDVPQLPAWKDLPVHLSAVARLAYSRDGERLATCGYDGVRIWNARTFKPMYLLSAPAAVTSVAFSPNGSRVAGGTSGDNAIRVWQTDQPNQRPMVIHGHSKKVLDVAFPESEDELWSSGDGGRVMVWDLNKCRPFDAVRLQLNPQRTGLSFLPDGRQLLVGVPGRVDSYDVADIAQKKLLNRTNTGYVNGRWSVDWTAADKTLRAWDLLKGKILRTWRVDLIEGANVVISRDGSTVAWARSRQGDRAGQLTILGLSPDAKPQTVEVNQDDGVIYEVRLSPDGKRCAVRGNWNTNFWDLSDRKPKWVRTLENFGPDYCTAFSPDGKLLAVGSWNNDVRIHDAKTGELLRALQGHSSPVFCLDFSADGKTLISGSWGGAIKLWDPDRGELRTTLRGHVGRVNALAMSPDGRSIASYGADRWLRVWRAASAEQATIEAGKQSWNEGNSHLYGNKHRIALNDFQRAGVLLPKGSYNRHDAAYRSAFLLVHFDQIDEYRNLCRRIAAEYANTDNFQIMERTLKMCAFADVTQHQDVVAVISRFRKHVAAKLDREAKKEPRIAGIRHWIHQALGIAAYRLGDYPEAESRLRKSNALFAESSGVRLKASQTAANLYYLALAAQRAGRNDEARQRLAEANARFAALPPDTRRVIITDWIVLQSARQEAQALITGKAAARAN